MDLATSKSLAATLKPNQDDESPSVAINPLFATVWLGLVAWSFTVAPGSIGSPQDNAMIQAIIANPVSPGINELYYTFFNCFATIPVILASIALPQGQRKGLPAAPFLILSAFLGYFAAGPYLALRAKPRTSLDGEIVGGFTRNVLENKAFSWFILAFTLYLPVTAQVFPAFQQDPSALWNGFVELVSTSRFAAVSMVDITILYLSAVALTPQDYQLRRPNASDQEAMNVALATAVLPILGSALYCALRPALPETDNE
ncbi:hypothetical protein MPSEU_000410000 [Mayamaea pseudoterrestris]|nr:hypothetical protein MPSEU_000410000 [Mayamaea pseudoterrestris]